MTAKKSDFVTAIGRRKAAVARVRINTRSAETQKIIINDKDVNVFFNYFEWQDIILSPLVQTGKQKAEVQVKIKGGGYKSQVEAIRLGISRALIKDDKELRPTLKRVGYLTRDPRIKERKKPGLKKARRAPQWSKR